MRRRQLDRERGVRGNAPSVFAVDAANRLPGRAEKLSGRNAQHPEVKRKIEKALNRSFAVRARTADRRDSRVLERRRDDFRRARAFVVDENDDAERLFRAVSRSVNFLNGAGAVANFDDRRARLDEFVANRDRVREKAARVAAKVQNNGRNARFFERFKRGQRLRRRRVGELFDRDVTDFRIIF